jgi:hypothetical protein
LSALLLPAGAPRLRGIRAGVFIDRFSRQTFDCAQLIFNDLRKAGFLTLVGPLNAAHPFEKSVDLIENFQPLLGRRFFLLQT